MNIQPLTQNYKMHTRVAQNSAFRKEDIYHSIDDYLERYYRLSFLDGVVSQGRGADVQLDSFHFPENDLPVAYQLPPQDWQDRGRSFLAMAGDRLMRSAEAGTAREYLRSLGLQEWLWHRALLGYTTAYDTILKHQRPAVCIPHMDIPMNLLAVRFLFVDDEKGGLRYSTLKGSKPLFYGLDTLRKECETLLIVEDEFNQLSIYQEIMGQIKAAPRMAVVSLGGKRLNMAQRSLLESLKRRYKRVIVWMDSNKISREKKSFLDVDC